jgi:hypothetical protein
VPVMIKMRAAGVDYNLYYDPTHQVLLILMGRAVTQESALAAYNAVRRFMAVAGQCSAIADLSGIESVRVSGHFIRSLALLPRAVAAGKRLVLVAPRPVIYGLSRMFHICRGEPEHYAIVRSLEEAYALLALVRPDFRTVDDTMLLAGAA